MIKYDTNSPRSPRVIFGGDQPRLRDQIQDAKTSRNTDTGAKNYETKNTYTIWNTTQIVPSYPESSLGGPLQATRLYTGCKNIRK